MGSCAFNKLFAKNVPHILENIFLSLDYESYKVCLEVNDTWEKLLSSESYQKIGKSVFRNEILKDEWKLWNVAEHGNEMDVKRLLLSKMIDINSRHGSDLSTPLHQVSRGGNIIVGQLLLDRGADPNEEAGNGWTPLLAAVHHGQEGVVQLLLESGAEVNNQFKNGFTPLHIAAAVGRGDIVQILLKKGAIHDIADVNGRTPLSDAICFGHKDIVSMLLDGALDL